MKSPYLQLIALILTALVLIEVTQAKSNTLEDSGFVANPYTDIESWEAVKNRVKIANPNMLSQNPAFEFVESNPNLPNILLIGDSISIGYTMNVRTAMNSKANVYRVPTNGGWTSRGLKELDQWLSGIKWDVIHFNWGLHDLKRTNPLVNNGVDDRQSSEYINANFHVSPEDYRKNLNLLVTRLKKTGANLIWATTTPVPQKSFNRISGDEVAYNAIAAGVMAFHKIAINDLHAEVLPYVSLYQRPDDVHFNKFGNKLLGTLVTNKINLYLNSK